jgi:hypothetical protein
VRRASPRLPLAPLVERYGSVSALARALGRERITVSKWNTRGLPAVSADEVAVAVGLHPVEVWPDFHDVMDEFEQAA